MSDNFVLLMFVPEVECVFTKRQPPAPSSETNTEVTKTAIHRLAARGWLQKGVSPIDSPC